MTDEAQYSALMLPFTMIHRDTQYLDNFTSGEII